MDDGQWRGRLCSGIPRTIYEVSHYYSIETEDILACVDKGCLRSSGALGDLAVSTLSPRPCRVINYLQLLMDSADVIEVFLP